jgi:calcineurin-like phosphoesterase
MEPENVGRSWVIRECQGKRIAVVNILGGVFMDQALGESYPVMDRILQEIDADIILVDLHAEATGEKELFWFRFRDRVSAVIGTHTHVQTADEKILPGGTGYITDAGMTGAEDSVLGMKTETSMTRLVSKMSARYEPASGPAVICGIVFNTDVSGRCLEIRRFCEYE